MPAAAKPDSDPVEEVLASSEPEHEEKSETEAEEPEDEGHPEPVPTGHVLTQDNVSEPGVQKTHSGVGDFTHHDERHKDKDR